MKKLSLICISLIVLLSSCARTSNDVAVGFYSKIKDRAPSQNIDNSVSSTKKGEACVESYLGLYSAGDSSVEKAKEVAQIKKVTHIDRSLEGFGYIYQKGCTIVHGN
jgi:hypothetical protein